MPVLYFALALGITWTLQLPALLAKHEVIAGPPEKYMPLVGLGAFGPMIAAMIAARMDGSGIRALFSRFSIARVGAPFYVIALVAPGALYALAAWIWNLFGHDERLFYLPNRPEFIVAAIVFPLGEEIGWRGYALPKLLPKIGPVRASIAIGIVWTVWHAVMNALTGIPLWPYAIFFPYMIAGSVFFTWLFQRTRGSLLLAFLAHVGVHLNNPGHAMPDRYGPLVLHMAAYMLLAVVLVAADRKAWHIRAP